MDLEPRPVPDAFNPSVRQQAWWADALARGEIRRVRRGVFVPVPPAADASRRREAQVLAEVRGVIETLRTPYWFSHSTAALLWGCWTWRLAPLVHITQVSVPRTRNDSDGALRRHWIHLPPADRAELRGVPVVSLERAVVDCARSLPAEGALVVADSALRRGASAARIGHIVDSMAGARGIRQARAVIAAAYARSESPGESLVRFAACRAGAPTPTPQLEVATSAGTFRLDLGWADVRVGIEFDGAMKYSGADFGSPVDRLRAEKRRHDALVDAGWWVVRVSWDELSDLGRLGAKLLSARLRRNAPTPAG